MTPESINLVGQPTPKFELTDSNGTVHRSDDYAGRWLLMVVHRHLM